MTINIIEHTPYIWNKKKWYFLSIFYAKEKWRKLTDEIICFYNKRQSLFEAYIITFSRIKGEQIRVTFVTSENDNYNYSNEIQSYFQSCININPSISKVSFPYGSAIWCNYPNNSLAWDKFKLTYYSIQDVHLYKKTLDVILNSTNNNFLEDNFFSVGMYLITKGLFCIDKKIQKKILLHIINAISKDFKLDSWVKDQINKFDILKVCDTIESYNNEYESEYSKEMLNWLNEVKIFLKIHDYKSLYFLIIRVMGLTILRQLIILTLLNKWFDTKLEK